MSLSAVLNLNEDVRAPEVSIVASHQPTHLRRRDGEHAPDCRPIVGTAMGTGRARPGHAACQ